MARRADVLCAGGCGKLIFSGRGSLKPGKATCRACRANARAVRLPRRRQIKPRPDRTCAHCDGPLPAEAGWSRVYCSRQCARAKPCEICGADFYPHDNEQRTCSRTCGLKIKVYKARTPKPKKPKIRTIYIRWCAMCGRQYTGRARTCSGCRDRDYNQRKRPRVSAHTGCCACGQPVPLTRAKCDTCKQQARSEARRRRKQRERLRLQGIATESYTLAQIAERDHYRCGLCHKRVAMTQAVPHPKAPTIDHMVPIARGGDDTRANVQLAHFLCNSIKGDRGGHEQLALVG